MSTQKLANTQIATYTRPGGPGQLFNRLLKFRIEQMLGSIKTGRLELVWPDGERTVHGLGPEVVTVTLHSYEPLRSLYFGGEVGFAESYLEGKWSTNDIYAFFILVVSNENQFSSHLTAGVMARIRNSIAHVLNRNSLSGSRKNIAFHYDIGNEFYAAWLDPSMSYSSALYNNTEGTLEQAQRDKIKWIIDLVSPARYSKVLEIGCGWGTLANTLASECGCRVHAISLSNSQLEYARQASNNLKKVSFQFLDYRHLSDKYDHIVSIEMFEAVGMVYWDTYFRKLSKLLQPGGTALLQVITIAEDRFEQYRRNPDFIQRYIFKGGMLPTKSVLRSLTAKHGFELTQEEWFGDGYAATLASWRSNFEQNLAHIRSLGYDERFIRMWRYYLAYCETGFTLGRTDVGMLLLTRPQ